MGLRPTCADCPVANDFCCTPRPGGAAFHGVRADGARDWTLSSFAFPLRGREEVAAGAGPPARPPGVEALEGGALAAACVGEVPGAWRRFVERFAPLIVSVSRRTLRGRGLAPSADDLDDICENTFLAFVKDDFKLLRRYDDRYALTTYVGIVARTQARRFVRRKRHARADVDPGEVAARSPGPLDRVADADLRRALRATLEELEPRDRAVLVKFYFEGQDYRAIAEALGVSTNSVGAVLHRARSRLKRRLEKAGIHSTS
jgi:RNA polymerase sigma-70 factor (ECF subfamily)